LRSLEIKDLKKSFHGQSVLRGINLEIPAGQITVIIGGSGTGKSVLLKHIVGLVRPDSGQIFFDGINLFELGREEMNQVRMNFGMLFQDAALFDSMNVFENIAFPLRQHRKIGETELREIVKQKLRDINLSGIEEKYPSELSGGMRKRVGLARAIVLDPEVILYDEPTTGLDPVMAKAIDDLIVSTHQRLKATTVIISHDIHSSLRIANKIAMLHDGKVVAEGDPKSFLKSSNRVVTEFFEPVLRRDI